MRVEELNELDGGAARSAARARTGAEPTAEIALRRLADPIEEDPR